MTVSGLTPGRKQDFDRLYRDSYPRILGTLMAILRERAAAEDCAQEAYLKAFRAWKSWKQDAPAEAWLHRIALNTAFSHRRRERLRDGAELVKRLGRPPEPDFAAGLAPDLLRALRSLPPKQSAAIVLRHLHGYTNREIAVAVGVPERTIASRLAAAKAALRQALDERGPAMGTLPEPGVRSGG